MRLVVPEIKRSGELAVRIDELDAVLLYEVALLHLGQHVQTFQHPIRFRNQRFADVEPWELLTLEQFDRTALLGEKGRRGRTGRTAADHYNIRTVEITFHRLMA